MAGTTRDRLLTTLDYDGKFFELADLAGIERPSGQDIQLGVAAQAQVDKALAGASLVVWVVDGREGLTTADRNVGDRLRKTGKPVLVAINKCDHPRHDQAEMEFASYRFNGVLTLSALGGRGVDGLMGAIAERLPETGHIPLTDERQLRLGIVGRPNVGKSTLLNALANEERVVVSDIPGTTRDAIDLVIPSENIFGPTFTKWKSVRVVDTAGIRRRGKIGLGLEKWSLMRTLDAVKESEVVLFLIDANEGMVHQDMQIAQEIVSAGRALILVVNKWDQVLAKKKAFPATEEDEKAQEVFLNHLRNEAPFLYWVQVLFLSAKDRLNLDVVGKLVLRAYKSWDLQIDQSQLDELAAQLQHNPRLKNLQRIELEHSRPPVFHLKVEGRDLPHFSTVRMAENALREAFDIGPTPIKMWCVPSMKKRVYKKR